MDTVTALVSRDADTCWRVFTDASLLTTWVPGLRRAQILLKERGMASEIHFEFSSTLAYTLVYTYDKHNREVRWQPKLGAREGVTGFARFEPAGAETTRVTYGLEQGDARTEAERELGDPRPVLEAFANRMLDPM
jgi:uncharacterized protein YndB with AHSA1/START domain